MRWLSMRWHMRLTTALFALCVVGAGVDRAVADDRRPLPAFTLLSPAGVAVPSSQFAAPARPLLVFVGPDCRACDRLIAALVEWQHTLPPNRLVLVVGADADRARAYAEERGLGDTGGIPWYADPQQTGALALGLQRAPALVAVDSGRVEWIISGVLNEPSALESIVRNWMNR
jgi:hypothetical protein